jgi:beta-N-acetylhexosaminidase
MNAPHSLPLGVVVCDVDGLTLTNADIVRLTHPQVGGVILFSRNFESLAQVAVLCNQIKALRSPALFIAVDHEGGRVQRFREGFTAIPAMRKLGHLWDKDEDAALAHARDCGYVLASELRAIGIDLSFTPVLDVDFGESGVIGDRAFHRDAPAIAALAAALQKGLAEGGMASCGKHFPGHGYVRADSHHAVPIDERPIAEIEATDMLPYRQLIPAGLTAVMPAHVIYPKVDAEPAGFSKHWLQTVLRSQYRFDGLIFSDDLSMEGANSGAGASGGVVDKALAALNAGCDMVLLCNNGQGMDELTQGLAAHKVPPVNAARAARLFLPAPAKDRASLAALPAYTHALAGVQALA